MTKARTIRVGTYKAKDGKVYEVDLTINTQRLAGLKEWIRKAIRNGGSASKADYALTITAREKP